MDETVQALTFEEILFINWQMIELTEGFYTKEDDNLQNPGSLEYILEMCRGSFLW